MKLAALYSGGKDSHLATSIYFDQIEYLVTIIPKSRFPYMYHPINLHILDRHAQSMGKEILKFEQESEDELEILKEAMAELKSHGVTGIVTGAIASNYQYSRILRLAEQFNLKVIAPLWHIDIDDYLRLYRDYGLKAIIVGVYAYPLDDSYLLREYDRELAYYFNTISINPYGEGGEFETFVYQSNIMPRVEFRINRIEGKNNSWTAYLE
ncbi:MAG: diphthine--ammonia ligase [Candidatus Anstonellales archaeon]